MTCSAENVLLRERRNQARNAAAVNSAKISHEVMLMGDNLVTTSRTYLNASPSLDRFAEVDKVKLSGENAGSSCQTQCTALGKMRSMNTAESDGCEKQKNVRQR